MNLRFYRAPLLAALTLLTSACREESAEPKEIVIGFSQCCSDVFREAMLFDMQIESANYPNSGSSCATPTTTTNCSGSRLPN